MEVVVMSSEIVKPSTPTPPHLRRLPLSFLDQLSDPHFMPLIFYYTSTPDILRLKTSLSLTLSRFYPLAGRIQANDSVNCNDEGIQYRQAKVLTHTLLDVVHNSQPSDIHSLIPPKPPTKNHIMSIQVNFFTCGGLAIATHSSHKTMDALSVITFANAWAAAARNDVVASTVSPKFDMTALFPPRETSCYSRCTSDLENNVVSKRFIFSGSALSLLRDRYTAHGNNHNDNDNGFRRPSLVEALSTFIWTRFVTNKGNGKYALIQAVNLRTRIKPHLPTSYFGNLSRFSVVVADVDGGGSAKDGYGMVSRIRESIRKIDTEYLDKLRNGDLQLEWVEELKSQEGESLSFSALHKLPLPEVDFGVGSPTWVTLGGLNLKNTVYFLPTSGSSELGVEAWINLKEEDMVGFERDSEFLTFASPVSGLP